MERLAFDIQSGADSSEAGSMLRLRFLREALMAMSALFGGLGVFFFIYLTYTENPSLFLPSVLFFGIGLVISWSLKD